MKGIRLCGIKIPIIALVEAFFILVGTQNILARYGYPLASSPAQGQCPFSWMLFKPGGDYFSVKMPKPPSLRPLDMANAPNLKGEVYSASDGRVLYTIKSIVYNGKATGDYERLEDFIILYKKSLIQSTGNASLRLILEGNRSLNGFIGRQFLTTAGEKRGLVQIYIRKQRVYVLEVSIPSKDDVLVLCFLNSFTLDELILVPNPEKTGGGISILSPPTTQPTRISGIDFCECGFGYEVEIKGDKRNREAVRCPLPELEFTNEARKHQFSGKAELRLELSAQGVITNIEVVKEAPYGLMNLAMEAAKKIKFCPALIDGRPVDSTLILELEWIFRKRNALPPIRRTHRRHN